jgi:hypothetical protein
LTAGINALQSRLNNSAFWTGTECQGYLTQALREWSALTEIWKLPANFSANSTWYNTGAVAGPRYRTITDVQLYTQMQYMLMEPPTGGTWTGTNQFTLGDLQFALQRRRDEVIQATGCNLGILNPLATTPNTVRTALPDTVLEPRRIRFLPVTGNPITLTREDDQAFQFFVPGYLGGQPSINGPQSWSVATEPPLAFDVDQAPNQPGTYDVLALNSGPVFAPPASTLMGVPDDWAYLVMWGALADLLNDEAERTDRERALYCLRRFENGLKIMQKANWLVNANINGVPCDTPSLYDQDAFSPEWQNNSNLWPTVVQAGMDFIGVCPVVNCSVGLTLVGSAPVLDSSGTYLQVSRDDWESVLGYAQRLATFKMAGANFYRTEELEQDFYRAAGETNRRLLEMGIFTQMLNSEGQAQNVAVPRFAPDQVDQ